MEALTEQGIEPEALKEKPELDNSLGFYLKLYQDLQSDRPIGMAQGSIPWSSIVRYCELNQINNPDEINDIVSIIRGIEHEIHLYEKDLKENE